MTKKADKIIVLNKELSKQVQESFPEVSKSLAKSKFKYTSKALISFIPKTGYLNSAILDFYYDRNIYASAIIFRSIIEHCFRHLYIYTRALKENDDSVGNKYYKLLKASEDLESFTKINNYSKTVYPNKTKWNTKGEHNKAIRKVGQEFSISQIFFYLIENNKSDKDVINDGLKKYLLKRLEEYTNLSSVVHGGSFGESVMEKLLKNKDNAEKQLETFANESFGLHKSVVETTYLFAYLMDENMKGHYEKIRDIGTS